MPHIDFTYEIDRNHEGHSGFHNELIDCLCAIDRERSLVKAAKVLNISYRSLWSKIELWENVLGQKLVERDQGKCSAPSELGRKLLWAERTVQAKNALIIEQLRAQFESVFAQAIDPNASLITVSGCFDPWLASLPRVLANEGFSSPVLDMNFSTSQEGLKSLLEKRCDIAGFNLPTHIPQQSPFARAFGPFINPKEMQGVHFCVRTQGLATAPGNPLKLNSLIDIVRTQARYVNRSASSGTGLLLMELLNQAGLKPTDINGFDRIEPSHSAVATAIASGAADAGICEETAARKLGLEFTPLVLEHYYLVWRRERFTSENDKAAINQLINFLTSKKWKVTGENRAGYQVHECGQTLDMRVQWPWLERQ